MNNWTKPGSLYTGYIGWSVGLPKPFSCVPARRCTGGNSGTDRHTDVTFYEQLLKRAV